MLTAYPLNGFLRITHPERARQFYEQVLGLTFDYEEVKDIEKVVAFLTERGVVFERYPHMEQDALGI